MSQNFRWLLQGGTACLLFFFALPYLPYTRFFGIRFFFNGVDTELYFHTAAWVGTDQLPYRDVLSEYPLAANLLFGVVRWISNGGYHAYLHFFPNLAMDYLQVLSFIWVWMTCAWMTLLWLIRKSSEISYWKAWLWLSPAIWYYTLHRYDIYPALFCFLAFWFLQKNRWALSFLLLGICIALKGYALFLLPAWGFYALYREGFRNAILLLTLAVSPFVLSHAAIWVMSGWEGLMVPYKYHLERGLNGESTYDAIIYIVKIWQPETEAVLREFFNTTPLLKIGPIVLLLMMALSRPKTFEQLVHACLFGVVGFVSVTSFYSPQFILWIIPLACFTANSTLYWTITIYSLATYLYAPVAFDYRGWWYEAILIGLAGWRFLIMGLAWKLLLKRAGVRQVG